MDTHEVEAQFWRLCDAATQFDEESLALSQLEPYLRPILEFVKSNSEHERLFKKSFIELATGTKRHTYWILLYCMRELRYPEVQAAVNAWSDSLGGAAGAPRLMNYVSDVNWVFDSAPWEHADFFKYHWEREHPGEPWPCEPKQQEK